MCAERKASNAEALHGILQNSAEFCTPSPMRSKHHARAQVRSRLGQVRRDAYRVSGVRRRLRGRRVGVESSTRSERGSNPNWDNNIPKRYRRECPASERTRVPGYCYRVFQCRTSLKVWYVCPRQGGRCPGCCRCLASLK